MRQAYAFDDLRLFVSERRLERGGREVSLGSRAFDLLVELAENAGEVVSKETLLARAWPGLTVDEGSLRYHITGLRKALGVTQDGTSYIKNVPGRGYCLVVHTVAIERPREASISNSERRAGALPARLDRMVGRDEDIRKIAEKLEARRFVTIHGPGGIGKTTVAVAIGHQMLDAFEGAVYFLDLAVLEGSAFVASALASAFGIVIQSDDPTAEVVAFLRERRALVIFDSCEQVIGTLATLLERIYLDAPATCILATSREQLRVEGEHVVFLPSLQHPDPDVAVTASQLRDFSATRLFVERAAAHGYQSEILDADAPFVADICRKLDGMALAIELVASRVAAYGLRETSALVQGRFRLLWKGRRTAPLRHQTLAAMIDWSHALLNETEQAVLRRLSVFVGPFFPAAAAAVISDQDLASDHVMEALEGLVAKSLVATAPNGELHECRLLDTTREYAFAKLVAAGELDRVARRHALFLLDMLTGAGAPPEAEPVELSKQVRNLLAREANSALTWAFSERGDARVATRLAAAMARIFIEFSLLRECRWWTEKALEVLDDASRSTKLEMELDAALGHVLTFTEGNSERARSALQRALEVARRLQDSRSQFRLLSRLHMLYRRMGKYSALESPSREAQRLADAIDDPTAKAAAHNLLGVAFHLVGNQRMARQHLETARVMGEFRRIQPSHFAFHRNPDIAIARCLWLQGFPDQALATARPLTSEGVAPDVVTFCIGLIWSASVFEWVGDWDSVERLSEKLRAHAVRFALRPYQAVAHGMAGQSLLRQGDFQNGIPMIRGAINVLLQDNYEIYVPQLAATLAKGLSDSGEAGEASLVIGDVLDRVFENGGALEAPELLRIRGEIELARGDIMSARASFRQSIALAEDQGALSWTLRAQTSLARSLQHQDDGSEAMAGLADVYGRFTEGFHTVDVLAAASLLAKLERAGVSGAEA